MQMIVKVLPQLLEGLPCKVRCLGQNKVEYNMTAMK